LAIISGSWLILAVLAFAYAESQKATATREQRNAQSIQLAASAQATLDSNTELSTLLALRALTASTTDQAVQALRSALSQLGELTTLRAGVKLNSAAFSPDGKEIVTASDGIQPHWNATLRIWSAISHKLLGTIVEPHAYAIESAAFSPDGKKIITADQYGTAWVLSASTDKRLRTLAEPFGNGLTMAAFSPDGTRIVTTSEDGSAQVWSATSFRLQRILTEPGHNPRKESAWRVR
jgi:WD40 repeat protein